MKELIKFEGEHPGKAGILFSSQYNSFNGSALPALNATFESIGGPVDVDWMLRTASFGAGKVLGVSSAAYNIMKPVWNMANQSSPTAGMSEPGHATAAVAAFYWMNTQKTGKDMFSPALQQCDCTK